MPMDFKEHLAALQGDLKGFFSRNDVRFDKLQTQVDAIDTRVQGRIVSSGHSNAFLKELKDNDDVGRLLRDRKGRAILNLTGRAAADFLERKTIISSGTGGAVGAATSGVLQIDRIPGITAEARQVLTIRDLLTANPTQLQIIDFVKVNAPMVRASPQVEASDKFENAVTFTSVSERVRTIATWIPATKQVLDDFTELANFLNGSLRYYVDLAEETQLLSGDATGENLDGLITQATSFQTGLLSASAGWTKLDIIARAIEQIQNAKEVAPTFAVVHPTDWWGMRLTKNSFGQYILGDPQTMIQPRMWGLDVIPTTSIASGTFLVGSGNPVASEIRDRMELQIEISTEHSDYFVKNLVAIRAEKRLALIVKRPGSYISGSLSTSP